MIELEKATNGGEKATVEALNANTFAFKQKLGGSKSHYTFKICS